MGRKRGYIRVWKDGPTEQEQRDAMRPFGVEVDDEYGAVYVDAPSPREMKKGALALKSRAECIRSMRERPEGEQPDELVIVAPWVLAVSPSDLFGIAAKIAERGAVIRDLSSGQVMRWTPEMAGLAAMAEQVARFQHKRKTEKARLTLATGDIRTGPKPKLTGKLFDLFMADWGDATAGTNEQIAERHRIGVTTAHRLAGMSRTEAIRRAERAKHDRLEQPAEMKPKRGRRPKPPPST